MRTRECEVCRCCVHSAVVMYIGGESRIEQHESEEEGGRQVQRRVMR